MNVRLAGPRFLKGADTLRLDEKLLMDPLRWKQPRRIFVCSMTDLFMDEVPDEWILRMFTVMRAADWHTYQILTKRHLRMAEFMRRLAWRTPSDEERARGATGYQAYLGEPGASPLPQCWLGVSAETQSWADKRIPALLRTPAAVRFASIEPMLGPIELKSIGYLGAAEWRPSGDVPRSGLDLVIAGGESGPRARPTHPEWVRALRDQCVGVGVPFFFKQWGEWAPAVDVIGATEKNTAWVSVDAEFRKNLQRVDLTKWTLVARVGKKKAGRALDGRHWDEMPQAVRVT